MRSRQGSRSHLPWRSTWFALGLVACATGRSADDPANAGAPASTLVLAGDIDGKMLERLSEGIAAGGITAVRITAYRGQMPQALQIAEVIQENALDVYVHRLCIGPCQHLLVAGHKRVIEDGALAGFTHSASALASIRDVLGDTFPADFQHQQDQLQELAAREQKLYGRRGVDPSFLLATMEAVQPRCVIFRRTGAELTGLSLNSTYSLWVPTRKELASMGVEVEGYWPSSRKQMVRTAEGQQVKRESIQAFRFGNDDHLRRRGSRKYSLNSLAACSLEEEAGESTAPSEGTQ